MAAVRSEVQEPRLLHRDEHLLMLEKPAGLLSVPGRGEDKQDCLSARVQALYPEALVVHRLDMATSGLLLMARGAAAQSALNRAFAAGAVHKRYEAVVEGLDGTPAPADGWHVIDRPIALDWPRRPRRIVPDSGGKPSKTRWRVLEAGHGRMRVELEPLTGRSHQLRVHLQSIGHPILGDALYGHADAAPRLLLHATGLQFAHPMDGAAMVFTSRPEF